LTEASPEAVDSRRLELFRVLVEEAREYAIFFLEVGGDIASWNAGAERIKGYTADEVIGRPFSIFYPADRAAAGEPAQVLARAAVEGRVETEGWRVRKDGSRFWAGVVITAVRDAQGKVTGFTKLTRDLTEQHQARETVRRSQEELAVTLRSIGDALIATDEQGRVTLMNPVAENLTGWPAAEANGRPLEAVFRIVNEETRATVENPVTKVLREGTIVGLANHTLLIARDGTELPVADSAAPIRHSDGSVRGVVLIFRDQSSERAAEARREELVREHASRKAAEASAEALRLSEERHRATAERLRAVLDAMSDGVVMQDRELRIIYANGHAARMSGYEGPEAMMSAPLADLAARFNLFDENGEPISYERVPSRRALMGEGPGSMLAHVRDRRSGRDWWSLIHSVATADAQGRPESVVSVWQDVTARRRREEELRFLADAGALLSSTLEYEVMLKRLAALIVPRMADWCSVALLEHETLRPLAVTHVDPAKVNLARELQEKYPPDPGQTNGAYQVIRTRRSELHSNITDDLLIKGARSPEHLQAVRALGLRSAMVVPIAARGEAGLGAITFVWAESDRRYDQVDLALAEELGRRAALAIDNARLYLQLQEAVHARDEFLAVAGHELRTPLAALQLQLDGLELQTKRGKLAGDEERFRQRLSKAVTLGSRLAVLVSELLDVSKITAGRLAIDRQPCDLSLVVRDVADRFEDQIVAARCELRVRQPGPTTGEWDRHRVDQMVSNLLANAIKYGRGKPIELSVDTVDDRARLTVRDHGIGIAPEDQERIFERFERAVSDGHYAGFGLGLWIARQVVESHGGTLRLESRIGEGATFVVELPRSKGGSGAEQTDPHRR
jgi:PAS domain S-box-containing protein